MSNKHIDVYAIGNALVDTEYEVQDGDLPELGLEKAHTTLIDADQLRAIRDNLSQQNGRRAGGGSAANTVIGVAGFGGSAFYSCQVSGDADGAFFLESLNDAGVGTNPHDPDVSGTTGVCIVLITPDAERTMGTYLGVSESLSHTALNSEAMSRSKYLYIEGYLASSPTGSNAAIQAHELANNGNTATALTLSDPSMVALFKDPMSAMLGNGIHHLFCNEEEALAWCVTDRVDVAIAELKDLAQRVDITLGSRGSVIFDGNRKAEVSGEKVTAIDTTGAGDIYAAACLHALTQGADHPSATRFANSAAAYLVTQYGARLSAQDYRHVAGQLHTSKA